MVKAAAMKKRYIAFEFRSPSSGSMDSESLKRAIYDAGLRFFGEYGMSFAALKLVEYFPDKKIGLIRCERSKLDEVLGFLALIDSLNGKQARLVALSSSGTMKSIHDRLDLGPVIKPEPRARPTHSR
jgi:RNase P/RNase MRP subunit POP5